MICGNVPYPEMEEEDSQMAIAAEAESDFWLKKQAKHLLFYSNCIIFACKCNTVKILSMAVTIIRKPASFRLRADLLERLKRNAARENRTLNNYVESVLLDIVYHEPNDVTKAAIAEAQSGKNPNKVYDSVDELFNDLDAEKWRNYNLLLSTRRTIRE